PFSATSAIVFSVLGFLTTKSINQGLFQRLGVSGWQLFFNHDTLYLNQQNSGKAHRVRLAVRQ
ncbi:MAG: hypothetical protein ACKO13_05270, partial [Cytophagales bacterium]